MSTRNQSKSEKISRYWMLLVGLFFASGVAGLGYQVVWAKLFAAGIGHEFPAALGVVTAFMAGMGIGAWLMDRLAWWMTARRSLYGWLELLIAGWGACTIFLIPFVNDLIIRILGVQPSAWFHWSVVFSAVFLTLLPATAAMGATLPVVERFAATVVPHSTVGLLYAANTAGAVLGGLLSVFIFMPRFGILSTIVLLAILNGLCGVAALSLARRFSIAHQEPTAKRQASSLDRRACLALVVTGLLGIGYEMVVVRALSHVLENTIYTFAVVLAIYLLGTALGAGVYHRFSWNKKTFAESALFLVLVVGSILGGLTFWKIQTIYEFVRSAFAESLFGVACAEMMVAAVVFLIPCIGMGATFSHLIQRTLSHAPNVGMGVAWNTLGAAMAPLLFGLLIIPKFGLQAALAVIPLGYALLIRKRALQLAAVLAVLLLAFALPGANALIQKEPGTTVRSLKEGIMASVTVLEDQRGERVLKVNNRFQMGGTSARVAEERHADIPLLLHANPRRALFIGLGTGITFATSRFYQDLVSDGVELLPEVIVSMDYFQPAPDILSNPHLRIHEADGRRFVLTATNYYDVIVADLFHPTQDGSGFLYTREHFQAIRQRLASNGIFCQWLPLHQMDLQTVRIITRTFLQVFPEAEAWLLRFNIDTPVLGLISRPRNAGEARVEKKLGDPELHEHLKRVALADSIRLFGCFLAGAEKLTAFSQGAELNTDLHPRVIFRAPHVLDDKITPGARLLALIELWKEPNLEVLSRDTEIVSRTQDYIKARDVYLNGLLTEANGGQTAAIAAYIESSRLSVDFTSGYAQCISIATALASSNPAAARAILEKLVEAQPERQVAADLLQRLQLAQ